MKTSYTAPLTRGFFISEKVKKRILDKYFIDGMKPQRIAVTMGLDIDKVRDVCYLKQG